MGNILLPGFIHRHGRRIKIMKADGTVMKLQSPVSVKEILIDYPNHGLFEAPDGPPLGIGNFSRPLPERAGLVGGHLYYLMPLPLPLSLSQGELMIDRGPFARASSVHSIPSSRSWLQPLSSAGTATDSIKQEAADCAVHKIKRGGVTIVSSSYSADGSTIRVKLRLRKEELASFLSGNNDNVVIAPLIQGATRQSALSPWKPNLDTIAEQDSRHGDS